MQRIRVCGGIGKSVLRNSFIVINGSKQSDAGSVRFANGSGKVVGGGTWPGNTQNKVFLDTDSIRA